MKNSILYDWRDGTVEFVQTRGEMPLCVKNRLCASFDLPDREYDSEAVVEDFRADFGAELAKLGEGFNWIGQWPQSTEKECMARAERLYSLADEIHTWAGRYGYVEYDASEYYAAVYTLRDVGRLLGITADTTDADLDVIVDDAESKARREGYLLTGMRAFAEHVREHVIENGAAE